MIFVTVGAGVSDNGVDGRVSGKATISVISVGVDAGVSDGGVDKHLHILSAMRDDALRKSNEY